MQKATTPCLAALLSVMLPQAPAAAEASFSQYPGFAKYFAEHPRRTVPATAEEQTLLERWRPRLWVGAGQEDPISFYEDYIAQGRLHDAQGKLLSEAVSPEILNAHRTDPDVVFVHTPSPEPGTPLVFGRVDREPLLDLGEYRFLTYHFVFRHSGLAAGLHWWQSLGAVLGGDPEDWHQLDHYTAATLALDPQERPVGLILQQHNGLRSYWLGVDLPPAADGRVRLCAALRSNELYPCGAGPERHRVVPFMSPDAIRYLVTGENAPWMSAEDITEPAREIEYRLGYLPPADAFYSFAGYLGERRRLPGREGPPGADYYAEPALFSRSTQLIALHWRENDTGQMRDMLDFLGSGSAAAYERLATPFRAHVTRSSLPLESK